MQTWITVIALCYKKAIYRHLYILVIDYSNCNTSIFLKTDIISYKGKYFKDICRYLQPRWSEVIGKAYYYP